MLPGKTYKPEEFFQIFRKRLWLIVVPWAIIAATTAGVARLLPDQYQSKAQIQMVPPRVPDSIMRAPSMASMQDRLRAIQQQILSRTRLERLIKEFNLYPERQKTDIMEDIAADMLRDIKVSPSKGDVFIVQYTGRDPVTVLKVTERLARHFIDESMTDSTRKAEGVSAYVDAEVAEKERELKETETKLTNYRRQYAGELPENVSSNAAAIQTIQQNLQSSAMQQSTDMGRVRDIERQIAALEDPSVVVTVPTGPDPVVIIGPASARLAQAKQNLQALQAKGLLPDHYQVQAAQRQVNDAEKAAAAEALRMPVSSATAGLSPAEIKRQQNLSSLRAELETTKSNMALREANDKAQRARALDYQAKIDRAQLHQAEITALTRDYDVVLGIYKGNVGKREAAESAVNLERRQIGEQFNLLDAAQLPQKPISPDRLVINIFGLVAGLALGLALVVLLEYRDTSFKTDTELSGVLNLPVLAVVPLMRSDAERRSLFRRRLIMNLGFGSVVSVCFAVVAYSFVFLR